MSVIDFRPQVGSFGSLLKYWRTTQDLTQLELANRASTTTRYISFLETGRSKPGEAMVLRLARALDVPKREHDDMLLAAGYAPPLPETGLKASAMEPYRRAIHYSVSAHEPYPSFAINRWYDIIEKNEAAEAMFGGDRPDKEMNIIHAIFEDPETRHRMENWPTVARAMAARLRREALLSPQDERLRDLMVRVHDQISGLSCQDITEGDDFMICPTFKVGGVSIRTISMVARFGTTRNISLDEIRVETLFPFDEAAEDFFKALAREEIPVRPCWQDTLLPSARPA